MSTSLSHTDRWKLEPGFGIAWEIHTDNLPHTDEIEMSGKRVSLIVRYGVDASGHLIIQRRIIWPQLRTIPNNTHASLRIRYEMTETMPRISINGKPLSPEIPRHIRLDGLLTITSKTSEGLQVQRVIFPSPHLPVALERWILTNLNQQTLQVKIDPVYRQDIARGTKGIYLLEVTCDAPTNLKLLPGESFSFGIFFTGKRLHETLPPISIVEEENDRRALVNRLIEPLQFECPEPLLSRAFDFAKLRAAESIFETLSGLMHCPGGDAYYAAVWCNDQCEYASPFFPYLGDSSANEAALNSYRLYMPFMGPNYDPIPSSIIAEGMDIWEGAGDRGDAAMYAYGAARFALALGDRKIAEELWPAIEWCLEYCRRKTTPNGVIASDSDELEGRFSHGKTNLATSTLTFGGLQSAAHLAHELGKEKTSREYQLRAKALEEAIERVFGAFVQGYATYRYHEGLQRLRSWICLPLVMGIQERKKGTIDALFSSKLWSPDGLRTEEGNDTFWDRSTLYGFRGVFFAGEIEKALEYFRAYSRRRLLGDHVPYPVEAYPEGNQRHLSAESALYCRVVIEGIFGITPTGLSTFQCTPHLPLKWNAMALRSLRAFGREFDLVVERSRQVVEASVLIEGRTILTTRVFEGESFTVTLP
ncbi:hypothetical protein ATHL_00015 [Anaerolinea thermolimosa]|uniref:hypothetical protein n=1 Tax=Anaerolinea thermolimosa TaxID=229919 RepID=UPI000781166A|nr:hypothetical protein [Anaerolinea thermolimosa]GAP05185.1 hypothetical protein ATHL_00015 [Anaerolinea thermolimosa]